MAMPLGGGRRKGGKLSRHDFIYDARLELGEEADSARFCPEGKRNRKEEDEEEEKAEEEEEHAHQLQTQTIQANKAKQRTEPSFTWEECVEAAARELEEEAAWARFCSKGKGERKEKEEEKAEEDRSRMAMQGEEGGEGRRGHALGTQAHRPRVLSSSSCSSSSSSSSSRSSRFASVQQSVFVDMVPSNIAGPSGSPQLAAHSTASARTPGYVQLRREVCRGCREHPPTRTCDQCDHSFCNNCSIVLADGSCVCEVCDPWFGLT